MKIKDLTPHEQALLAEYRHRYRKRELEQHRAAMAGVLLYPFRALVRKRIEAQLRYEERLIRESNLFDLEWYKARHPESRDNPIRHYLRRGALIGADPSPHFSTLAYLEQNPGVRASGLNPLVDFIERTAPKSQLKTPREDAKLEREVQDAVNKLWGGLSQAGVQELEQLASDIHSDSTRALANYELARWYHWLKNYDEAARHVKECRRLDKQLFRQLRPRILEIDVLTKQGALEEAKHRIDDALSIPNARTNGILAYCNYLHKVSPETAEADILEALNKIYLGAGLSPVKLAGTSGPAFLRLDADAGEDEKDATLPKISVLMAAHNSERFLPLAIESILKQSWRNLELVVVDDASSDGTWDIIQRYQRSDPRVRAHRNNANLGAYATRNEALRLSDGDYVTVHDSDDWSHPQMLALQMRPILENPAVQGTFSMMARATEKLEFITRPHRNVLEFIHRSYPSLIISSKIARSLGGWDAVVANADDDFVQRIQMVYGGDALINVLPDVPLSIFSARPDSLTESSQTSLRSLTFGVRQEYARSAAFWRNKTLKEGGSLEISGRTDSKSPFPCPAGLLPDNLRTSNQYDLVLVSDLSLLGGTRSCNVSYIRLALERGLRIGLFHWPRGDLRLVNDIAAEYRNLSYHSHCDILTAEDQVNADLLLIHHPPILGYKLDFYPSIKSNRTVVLVNQLPMQLEWEAPKYYSLQTATDFIADLFGNDPVWVSISPWSQRILRELIASSGAKIQLLDDVWFPPVLEIGQPAVVARKRNDRELPLLGRHSRDHWTKWPGSRDAIRTAYLADARYQFRVLGGARSAVRQLGSPPANWEILPFDSISVSEFISNIDIFINFNHEGYIEEFGRNVAEAMAAGVPVIAGREFSETFGEAIITCAATQVEEYVEKLWADPDYYQMMVTKGQEFVLAQCGSEATWDRLTKFLEV